MRAAQSQASNLENNAAGTAAGYGSGAENISSVLTPFLTRNLNNPQGISQQDQTAMLSAGEGGAGGLSSGLNSENNERAAATGNGSAFASSGDDIARMKAAALGSSSIATDNAHVKLGQQDEAAKGLSGMYGTDVGAQLRAMGVQNDAIGSEVNAGSNGWFQNMTGLISSLGKAAQGAGAMMSGGGGGGGG
jgi:hypothetical protein